LTIVLGSSEPSRSTLIKFEWLRGKIKGKGIMESIYLLGKKENMPEVLQIKKA
jgi:hypothetical protein